ncbi:MAG: hypothetical protein CPSOU_1136 [uncultured Paraburkholderia sp.]|nr:MAG: hypothetical protein CPSOU_1136 [uncultured Paraburkholderia sp.]
MGGASGQCEQLCARLPGPARWRIIRAYSFVRVEGACPTVMSENKPENAGQPGQSNAAFGIAGNVCNASSAGNTGNVRNARSGDRRTGGFATALA